MTPYLALARSAPAPSPPPRPGEADVSSDRLSSIVGPEPELPANKLAKTKMTRSPEAAAPTRRLEQVGLPQSSRESVRLVRARDGSESVERCRQRRSIGSSMTRRSPRTSRSSINRIVRMGLSRVPTSSLIRIVMPTFARMVSCCTQLEPCTTAMHFAIALPNPIVMLAH